MPLHQTKTLTAPQKQEVLHLVHFCCAFDTLSLSYPVSPEEDAFHYLLYTQSGQLLSVLALLPADAFTMECIAFTHPGHRKCGCFSQLLSAALESFPDVDLLFPVSGSCPDTMATLNALDAKLEYQEHQMERSLPLSSLSPASVNTPCYFSPESAALLTSSWLQPPSDPFADSACWTLFQSNLPKQTAGSCLTSPAGPDQLCLHQVEIAPNLRGRGYGTALILGLLQFLSKTSIRKVSLQVSGNNTSAMALYKKTGFQITETLSYYLY